MARRTIDDLDKKILEETIRLGAENGVSKVSVLKLAKNCNITDTTVFVHFKNKEKLIISAYEMAIDNVKQQLNMLPSELNYAKAKSFWHNILEYLLAQSDYTLFLDSFIHSPYQQFVISSKSKAMIEFIKSILKGKEPFKLELEQYHILWINAVETTIRFATRILTGKISNSPENKELMFHIVSRPILMLN